jgi:Family of unknown function (DUF5677)
MSHASVAGEIEKILSEALLSLPQPKDYADLYITAAALKFRSHFRAARVLLHSGFDMEAWILIRSLTELLIRTKWVKHNKSNAVWIIVGTELKELNQFKGQKTRSKMKTKAIESIQERLDTRKSQLPRNARYWNPNRPGELAALPSAEAMARECGLLKVYRSWFKLGSDHTHSSHRVLERFMAVDENGIFKNWILDPKPEGSSATGDRLNCLAVGFLAYLRKFGWLIDDARLRAATAALPCF